MTLTAPYPIHEADPSDVNDMDWEPVDPYSAVNPVHLMEIADDHDEAMAIKLILRVFELELSKPAYEELLDDVEKSECLDDPYALIGCTQALGYTLPDWQ